MKNACSLPVSRKAALMPDAHVGYGLPIGGVLAAHVAIIRYAGGFDNGCCVMVSVVDLPMKKLEHERGRLAKILEENTRFGIGAHWKEHKEHPVLDANWSISGITKGL